MNKIFTDYINTIVSSTFQFTPIVLIEELPNKTIQVILDGTDQQRKEMMGKEANTFHSLKLLLKIFAHKHDRFGFLYIKAPKNNAENTHQYQETN